MCYHDVHDGIIIVSITSLLMRTTIYFPSCHDSHVISVECFQPAVKSMMQKIQSELLKSIYAPWVDNQGLKNVFSPREHRGKKIVWKIQMDLRKRKKEEEEEVKSIYDLIKHCSLCSVTRA